MTATPNEKKRPTPLSPRELLLGELPGAMSLWERAPAPHAAQTVLALWAGLQRLAKIDPDPARDRLDDLVRAEAARLVRLASQETVLDVDDWLRQGKDLDRAWEAGDDEAEEIDWRTHQLFERLDRAALTVCAVGMLDSTDADADGLAAASDALARADSFLAERTDLFLCLATDVAAVLSAVRPGLEGQQPELWDTLLRHRRVEDARDQMEAPLDRTAWLRSAHSAVSRVRPSESVGISAENKPGGTKMKGWFSGSVPVPVWAAALAACLVVTSWIAIWGVAHQTVASPWGWNKPDAFPQDLARGAYLDRIAAGAEEWVSQPQKNEAELADRIAEFRRGCTKLLYAEHRPLTDRDKAWLREKCHQWKETVQTTLSDLEEGHTSPEKAREMMKQAVEGIVRELHTRAKEAAGNG